MHHQRNEGREERAWSLAHPAIRRIAYGVLVLLTLCSTLLGLYRGKPSAVIISIVIVVSLFLVIIGLTWIANREDRYWRTTGNILITATISGIVGLFLTILFYIGTGYPVWLDVWFGPPLAVAAPEGVGVSRQLVPGEPSDLIASAGPLFLLASTSVLPASPSPRNVVRDDDGSFRVLSERVGASIKDEDANNGIGLIRARRSESMIAPTASYVRLIFWDADILPDVEMEVEVRERDTEEYTKVVVSGREGRAEFRNLLSNTQYEYRLTAVRKGRRSTSVNGCFATPLDYYVVEPQPYWPDFITYYSTEWDCSGAINSRSGEIIYERLQYGDLDADYRIKTGQGVARWIYKGEIVAGEPNGAGQFYADPVDCIGYECGTECDLSSEQYIDLRGTCIIFFGSIQIRNVIYSGAQSTFKGSIVVQKTGNRTMGPLHYRFARGALEAVDTEYKDVCSGEWMVGEITCVQNAGFEALNSFRIGNLLKDKTVVESDCLIALDPRNNGVLKGTGFRATCRSLEIGEYRGVNDPYNGFSVDLTDGAPVRFFHEGVPTILTRPIELTADQCFDGYDFGLPPSRDWALACEASDGRSCVLSHRETDTAFLLSIAPDGLPFAELRSPANASESDTIFVDSIAYDVASRSSPDSRLSSLASMAQLCTGGKFHPKAYSEDVQVGDFCGRAAVAFARLTSCQN